MTDADPTSRSLQARPASGMAMRTPRWLWHQRIPQAAITLLAGREGIGKSTIDAALASWVTNGKIPGHYEGQPHAVAIVATEDAWEEVIVPRLYAAGADLDRVFRVDARTEEGVLETISVPADLGRLAEMTEELDVVMVILDPLMSVVHGSLDTHQERSVRKALDPLARFAATIGVAVVGNIHVNKTDTADPLTSIMASRAFTAVARSVLYCMTDPEIEREDRYLLGHPKSNLGPKQPTLKYHIVAATIDVDKGESPTIHTSRVVWDGEDDRTVRDALESRDRIKMKPRADLSKRIIGCLDDHGRPMSTKEIEDELGDVDPRQVRTYLSRLAKRGEIGKPMWGHYAHHPPVTSVATTTTDATGATVAEDLVNHDRSQHPQQSNTRTSDGKAVASAPQTLFNYDIDEPEPPEHDEGDESEW